MIEKHVNKFLEEVQKYGEKKSEKDLAELKVKATQILEAFIFKNLRLQNPNTYSLAFTHNYIPIEFDALNHTRSALSSLLDLIKEGEYLELPYSREVRSAIYYSKTEKSIRESFEVFEELFSKYPGQIDAVFKDLNRFAKILSQEGLSKRLEKFGGDLNSEIDYLERLQEDVLTWDDFRLFYGNESDLMAARLQRLLSAKIARQEMVGARGDIEKNHDLENAFPEIFAPNGYRLFDSLVKIIVKKDHGFQAEVGHFFRLMEYDSYAKKGDTRFMDWFAGNYPNFPELIRMRLLKEFVGPSHEARERRYYDVKHQLKLK
ncbi:hypothetical protein ACPUEN_11665 [Algoriphagus yeomjeoni]|uniref:hypothetical protein n=1 Tax=Algoriphagus yeomjeoni TaxID=291403 RepID=UPI003CE4B715